MLNRVSIFAFIAGSGWLASGGFEWIIGQNDKISNLITSAGSLVGMSPENSTFAAAFACGMFLQTGVVKSWKSAFENGLVSANTVLAVGMSFVSLISSSGNALLAFKHNELTNGKLLLAAEPMIAESEAAIQMVTTLSDKANEMSRRSNKRASVEERTGGSCTNVKPEKGKGKIYRMRMRHESEADAISGGLRGLSDRLDDLLIDFASGDVNPQARARTLQKSVQDALRDQSVIDLLDRAQVLENDMSVGWTDVNPNVAEDDPRRESEASCADTEYTVALQSFVQQFRQVMGTRLSAAIVDDTGLDDGFSRVFADTRSFLGGGPPDAGSAAMGASLMVELLQILAVYLAYKDDRRAGRVLTSTDRPFEPGTPLSSLGRKRKARILARIQACRITYRGQSYFACPNPGSLADAQVLDVMRGLGSRLEVAGVPSEVMNIEGWLDARPGMFPEYASFDLYSVPGGIFSGVLELSDDDLEDASGGTGSNTYGAGITVPAE